MILHTNYANDLTLLINDSYKGVFVRVNITEGVCSLRRLPTSSVRFGTFRYDLNILIQVHDTSVIWVRPRNSTRHLGKGVPGVFTYRFDSVRS